MFSFNFDISLITCRYIVNMSFIIHIEFMAIVGSSLSIIENSLIRDGYLPDVLKHMSGFTGSNRIRDMQS